jgi:geranylgeranyl pyrophosphate synthase
MAPLRLIALKTAVFIFLSATAGAAIVAPNSLPPLAPIDR